MNRRTFLKLTASAVAVAITTVPAMAKKSELQWVSFTERTPKVGQKVIIACNTWNKIMDGGTVIDRHTGLKGETYVTIPMKRDFSRTGQCRTNEKIGYIIFSEEGEKVIKTRKWLGYDKKTSEIIDFSSYEKIHINSRDYMGTVYAKDCHFWLPVDGEYPKTLPPIPKALSVRPISPDCYLPGGRSRWFDYLYSTAKV